MRIVFVYNADSGRLNAALDTLHKVFSPHTYECRLCELTHGLAGPHSKWKRALEDLPVEVEFLHRDQFRARHGGDDELPAVFVEEGTELRALIPAAEMREMPDLDALITRLRGEIEERPR